MFHIYQCQIWIFNVLNYLLVKILVKITTKSWYFKIIYWDKSNNVLYVIICFYILIEKYSQSMLCE